MKKLYAFVAIMAAVTVSAQGTESFTNLTASANGYSDGSYVGDNGITWTFGQARKATTADAINGTSIGFNSTGTRFVKANSGANGVGSITYKVSSYFTGGVASDRKIEVWVNGVMLESYTLEAMTTDYTRTVTANTPGDVVIEFRSTGTRQLVLDDVSWTAASTLAVINPNEKKINFVKSTVVDTNLEFGAKADVKIYDMNGRMLKAASVNEGTQLNVSALAKGVYIVAGEIEGQKVTQKIIKK